MKKFEKVAAQGDVMIIRIDDLPDHLMEVLPEDGKHVVAHSETGHHHTIVASRVKYFRPDEDAFTGYVSVKEETPLVHERGFDTHESIQLPPGNYMLRRQREYTLEGYRMAQD